MTENQTIGNDGGDKKAARAFRTIGEVAEDLGESAGAVITVPKTSLC